MPLQSVEPFPASAHVLPGMAGSAGRVAAGNVAMCISSLELLQDIPDLRLRRWEWQLEGSAGRAGAHSCHCTSLQPPAMLVHRDRREHVLEPFPGNCWKKGGNGLAPTNPTSAWRCP